MNSSSISSSSRTGPSRPALVGRTAGFCLGALVLFLGLNHLGGRDRIEEDIWFEPLAGSGKGRTVEALFLGTSRVSAAIETEIFDSLATAVLETPVRSRNLGMGYSTTAEYAMGLRRLEQLNPLALKGAVAFLEAPLGLPEFRTWDDSWVVDPAPELMSRYLEAEDLPGLVRSRTPVLQKVLIGADVLVGYKENVTALRRQAKLGMDRIAAKALTGVGRVAGTKEAKVDLSRRGGIRTDHAGVEAARALAVAVTEKDLKEQRPLGDWNRTALRDVVWQLRRMGARPVFFEMPMGSLMGAVYRTPVRQEDRRRFRKVLEEWNVPYLRPDFPTTDEDFPDLWHLRTSRAVDFTLALAQSYLEEVYLPELEAP